MRMEEGSSTPWAERVAAGVGLILLLGVLGFLGYKELTTQAGPPDVTVQVETIQSARGGYLVQITAHNYGEQSAAGVQVSGALKDGDTTLETAHTTFQYVPPGSERKGGLYFSRDPRPLTLFVRAEGYEKP